MPHVFEKQFDLFQGLMRVDPHKPAFHHFNALRHLGEGLLEWVDIHTVTTVSRHYTGGEGEGYPLIIRQYQGGVPPWEEDPSYKPEYSQWLSDGVRVPEEIPLDELLESET